MSKKETMHPFKRKQQQYQEQHPSLSQETKVTIHFQHTNQESTWDLWIWDVHDPSTARAVSFSSEDVFGQVATFPATIGQELGYVIRTSDWGNRNHPYDQFFTVLPQTELWVKEGESHAFLPPEEGSSHQIVFHYHRYRQDYERWNLWIWSDHLPAQTLPFTVQGSEGIAILNLSNAHLLMDEGIHFIIRRGDWESRDLDQTRWLSFQSLSTSSTPSHLYLLEGDAKLHPCYPSTIVPPLKAVTFLDKQTIRTTAFADFSSHQIPSVTNAMGHLLPIQSYTYSDDRRWLTIQLEEPITVGKEYYLTILGFRELEPIRYFGMFDSDDFKDYHYENLDLGVTYTPESTQFKVWSPTASELSVVLYADGHTASELKTIPLRREEAGIWSLMIDEDLEGIYYTYRGRVEGQSFETVDPYAFAAGVNGQRGLILDFEKTNPLGWHETALPPFSGQISDAVLYEAHLRDLSTHPSSGIQQKGQYRQFLETDTSNFKGLSTGVAHLVSLGITHLHLLPVFDYTSIDESMIPQTNFNWGYDPHLYFVPEGSYSSDPYDGTVRIHEFKQMVQSLHTQGIRLVMDMVYNHTAASFDSPLNQLVPGYYYRLTSDGTFANGSGCGNETASERTMVKHLMKQSLMHWVLQYHIDGFRFDLMALHDTQTLNELESFLRQFKPSLIFYGEGWTGGDSLLPKEQAAFKQNAFQTPTFAYFNDGLRDAIKGDVGQAHLGGWLHGNCSPDLMDRLKSGIVGGVLHPQVPGWQSWASSPQQSVAYVSAHDNHTLFDKLYAVSLASKSLESMEDLQRLQKQAGAILFTSQGVPFLHAGVEMLRSKGGEENSYHSPDVVNQMDWDLKSAYLPVTRYYQGLIRLRKEHSAFRLKTPQAVCDQLRFLTETPTGVLAFILYDHSSERLSELTLVVHNVTGFEQKIYLPQWGCWHQLVNECVAGTDTIQSIEGDHIFVQPHSSAVWCLAN